MENKDKAQQEEEINNPKQLQTGPTTDEDKELEKNQNSEAEQSGYTAQETKFADGKHTNLNEAIKNDPDLDNEEKINKKTDGTFEDQEFGKDEGLQPEVNDI